MERNQWECPACEQYNGFKEDGDYNKDLRAQYSPKYNKQPVARLPHHQTGLPLNQRQVHSTGAHLCDACNRNQELIVHQLASFTPSDECDYDEEVELYRRQLEEAYRLCPACERIVKRKLNQAKTLILGMKRKTATKVEARKRGKMEGLRTIVKRLVPMTLILIVVLILVQYFLSLWPAWTEYGVERDTMGYRLALGINILVLLAKGEPMNGHEYASVLSLCSLHFLIGEGLLKQSEVYPWVSEYMLAIEWALRVVALLASVGMLVDRVRWSPTSSVKLNDSFHRIEVEEEENERRPAQDDSDCRSMSYLRSEGRLRDTSTDFGSVFDYQTTNRADSMHSAEDDEIRNIYLNARSPHNRSDPVVQLQRSEQYSTSHQHGDGLQGSMWSKSPSSTRPSQSTLNLHSPSKLFPDDRFSNSINSMRIGGEYHQLQSPPSVNPFMKNMPPTASDSRLSHGSSATIYGSTRSLLAPSRLSLAPSRLSVASHSSAFTGAEGKGGSPWLGTGSGFWNHQYPNVFTAKTPSVVPVASSFAYAASACSRPSAAHSLDQGLNEGFVPLTESRSSSQSSGFESTSSCQVPVGSVKKQRPSESVFSSPWSGKGSTAGSSSFRSHSDTMGMGAFFEPNVFPR